MSTAYKLPSYLTKGVDINALAGAPATVTEAAHYTAPANTANGNNSYLYAAILAVLAALIIWLIFFKK